MRLLLIVPFLMDLASSAPVPAPAPQERPRFRDLGLELGVFRPGKLNALTDVDGVRVGHVTIVEGEGVRTGVTAILPHPGNPFQEKVPGAIHVGNGFGNPRFERGASTSPPRDGPPPPHRSPPPRDGYTLTGA